MTVTATEIDNIRLLLTPPRLQSCRDPSQLYGSSKGDVAQGSSNPYCPIQKSRPQEGLRLAHLVTLQQSQDKTRPDS